MGKTVVVTTTIRIPHFLKDLCENAKKNNRDDVSFVVIGDIKTPKEIREFCADLADTYSYSVDYYDIDGQKKALVGYEDFLEMMPLNSGSRKMVGNLMIYRAGCDRMIMIDDDNFIIEDDFFGDYDSVNSSVEMNLIDSDSGWYNVYNAVNEKNNIPFYPRGYPWSERFKKDNSSIDQKKLKVAVKNGLVLEDPDVDAISRLFWPIRVVSMKSEFEPHFGLNPGTWTSFNNQNTAISSELAGVYFTPPSTGRNADIWTSFLICCLASHMNEIVSFGHPLVRQTRNPHDLWVDLDDEALNCRAADGFVSLLRGISLTKTSYLDVLDELIDKALLKIPSLNLKADEKEMMTGFFKDYRIWHTAAMRAKAEKKV
ncbi:MAG: hypothetical protein PHV17_05130 [Candidatus Omnitrophica bacterium]|nr:hypothetical protein [Candidatus Omnitrophota bacterium]